MKKVKIVIITSGDTLSRLALSDLSQQLPGSFEVSGIVLTSFSLTKKINIFKNAFKNNSTYYAIYILIESFLSRFYINKSKAALYDLDQLPRIHTCNTMSEEAKLWVAKESPDVILSVRPGIVLREYFINGAAPILNMHHSNLPFYRGIGCVFQMMMKGETFLATSVHRIRNEEVDFGDVYAQSFIDVPEQSSVFLRTMRLYSNASSVLAEGVNNFFENDVVVKETEGTYFSWPGKQSFKLMRKMCIKLVSFADILGCFLKSKNRLKPRG